MDRDQLDKYLEWTIGGLVIALLLFLPLAFGGRPQAPVGSVLDPLLLDPFLVAQWACVPIIGLWIARLWVDPRPRLLWPPVCWVVLAFAAYVIFRYFTADIEYVARLEVLRILVYVFLFFVIINNLHRQETVQWAAFCLIAIATLVAAYAMFQFFTNSDSVWHVFKPYPRRGSGTYICPNHLGGFLELILPLALAYTLVGRIKPVPRILLGYCALVIMGGIVVTMSRGTWVATAGALLVFFSALLLQRAYRLIAAVALGILLVAGIYVLPRSYAFQARVSRIVSNGKISDDARFSLWKPALKMWQTQPWTGVGPAHFDYRFGQFRPEDVQVRPDRAHNDFLNALTDWGLIGLGLAAAIWFTFAVGLFKTLPFVSKSPRDMGGSSNSNKFAFVLGASIGLLAILFHSAVDFNLHIPANALIVVAFLALISSFLRFASSDYWYSARPLAKGVLSLVLLAGLCLLAFQAGRRTCENYWLAKARLVKTWSAEQVELLKKAKSIEPNNFETFMQIGEGCRMQSRESPPDYEELAKRAMAAFDTCMKLNPYDAGSTWRYGWCLDWLDRSSESEPYFARAEELDGNSYFVAANIGIHHVQTRNYATARKWFDRSWHLYNDPGENPIAASYKKVVNRLLWDEANRPIALRQSQSGVDGAQVATPKSEN